MSCELEGKPDMASAARRTTVLIGLTVAALILAACSGISHPAKANGAAAVSMVPQRILRAPARLISATHPRGNGSIWMLAGKSSKGLFKMDSSTGRLMGSVSVSDAAHSVAETSTGVLGVALGTAGSGALELLTRTGKVTRTVPLPAPARQVVVGSDGTTFYVLTGTVTTASVTIVSSRAGRVLGSVPMPSDAVSVVPDVPRTTLYALEGNGFVDQVDITGGKMIAKFKTATKDDTAQSIALSPDGSTLYVLKTADGESNVADVDVATEAVRKVLPAPSHCVGVLVSSGGGQLYDLVGTATYGNIQVFAA
jgi:DNA-binding beta-propeller fold protein YncE